MGVLGVLGRMAIAMSNWMLKTFKTDHEEFEEYRNELNNAATWVLRFFFPCPHEIHILNRAISRTQGGSSQRKVEGGGNGGLGGLQCGAPKRYKLG